ncbi:MAG: precorrin-3B C(17)-methyltransferase [Mycobacteriaceae bacterium]
MTGTLHGVGVGPGDPELLTVRAARLIGDADVVAYHAARPGSSIARSCAATYLRPGVVEEELVYPVTRGTTDHPGGYDGAMAEFYTAAADRLAVHLQAGRDVVLLAEGDPTLYSSFAHLQRQLSPRFAVQITPGITSVSASAAAAGTPLVEGDEVLSVVSATLGGHELAQWCERSDALVFLKVSRNLAGVTDALRDAGRLEHALVVTRASRAQESVRPLADFDPAASSAADPAADPERVPYMSTVVVPGALASRRGAALAAARPGGRTGAGPGGVTVVGIGPAGPQWLTPETAAALAAADDLVGYSTYVQRVPERPGQRRHASDNRVEAERAEMALDLARRGRRVAVVSSGDPGVFAMATAVLEVQVERGYDDVAVRVLPGVTAANAVASRVGAPLGHDYCVLSLSDQLKPWDVIHARLAAAASADLVLALYNTGSRTRTGHVDDVRDTLLVHRGPDTPVVVGRAVGSPDEQVSVVALGELGAQHVDMRTLLIVGSSTTVWDRGTGVVFTPRRYA